MTDKQNTKPIDDDCTLFDDAARTNYDRACNGKYSSLWMENCACELESTHVPDRRTSGIECTRTNGDVALKLDILTDDCF